MPLRSRSSAPPRYDPSVDRRPDPKHLFDREPLLIPQLFNDGRPPWYRRTLWWMAIVVSLCAASGMGVLVARHGPRGALARVARVGVSVMHVYTRVVAGRPAPPVHNTGR